MRLRTAFVPSFILLNNTFLAQNAKLGLKPYTCGTDLLLQALTNSTLKRLPVVAESETSPCWLSCPVVDNVHSQRYFIFVVWLHPRTY
jgi:hypothetical protein